MQQWVIYAMGCYNDPSGINSRSDELMKKTTNDNRKYEPETRSIPQEAQPHPQPKCGYSRTLDEVGDFCIIKDDWVSEYQCKECPASHSSNQQRIEQKFNSTELLLLANDEWKRREERKHNHENAPWVSGFINGFCTDKTWARKYIDALLQAGRK